LTLNFVKKHYRFMFLSLGISFLVGIGLFLMFCIFAGIGYFIILTNGGTELFENLIKLKPGDPTFGQLLEQLILNNTGTIILCVVIFIVIILIFLIIAWIYGLYLFGSIGNLIKRELEGEIISSYGPILKETLSSLKSLIKTSIWKDGICGILVISLTTLIFIIIMLFISGMTGIAILSIVFTVLLTIFTIALSIFWAFALHKTIFENISGLDALKESYKLVKGRFWLTFGILIIISILSGSINVFVQLPLNIVYKLTGNSLGLGTILLISPIYIITLAANFILKYFLPMVILIYVYLIIYNENSESNLVKLYGLSQSDITPKDLDVDSDNNANIGTTPIKLNLDKLNNTQKNNNEI
ncbi:MAG: hypothetical protein PHF46_04065, partial [Candidatus Gracilibacteria bacterium]|nr:hypothetical protein [Candidatus Gracilibacteria bacterium]